MRGTVSTFVFLCLMAIWLDAQEARRPIPSDTDQRQALAVVKEVYGEEYKVAESGDQKRAIVEKLFRKASESKADPTSQFVLLKFALDLAVEAGEAELALDATEKTAASFDINVVAARHHALLQASKAARTEKQCDQVVRSAFRLMDEAVAADEPQIALEIGKIGTSAAETARSKDLIVQLSEKNMEVREIALDHAEAAQAIDKMKANPTDPSANLAVGKYLCFAKGDWDRGLPMLALGNNETLKTIAALELVGVNEANEQAKLGDTWWDYGESVGGLAHKRLRQRACVFYKQALPGLAGMAKDRAEKRLQQIGVVDGVAIRTAKISSANNQNKQRFPSDAVPFGGHHYKVFWQRLTWTEAKDACVRQGGHLACIESAQEKAFLAALKGNGKTAWVGARRSSKTWMWINGKQLNKADLKDPAPPPRFDYVAFHATTSLNARPLNGHVPTFVVKDIQGYICEWDE